MTSNFGNLTGLIVILMLFTYVNSSAVQDVQIADSTQGDSVDVSGDQAMLIASVYELAFQPDSKAKYRLIHKKMLSKLVPQVWAYFRMTGTNADSEEIKRIKQAATYFEDEVEKVLGGQQFSPNDAEQWKSVSREATVEFLLLIQNKFLELEVFHEPILGNFVDSDMRFVRSVDVEISGDKATVTLNYKARTFVFEMEKADGHWQLVKFVDAT